MSQVEQPPVEQKWEEFKMFLTERRFLRRDVKRIRLAYFLAQGAHTAQIRENQEWYFEHARETTLILITECRRKDPNLVIAALLHDAGEDSEVFGDTEGHTYSQWKGEARDEIKQHFGKEVADIVLTLTKPKVDGIEIWTEEEALQMYYEQIRRASPKTLLVKMADRLHNLRTQYASTPEKQIRKIKETEEVYFPIFENARGRYPKETEYLIGEMKKSIEILKKSLYLVF